MKQLFRLAPLAAIAAITAPVNPALAQSAIYNPNLPVLTVPGDSSPLRIDANGNLRVTAGDAAAGAPDSGSPVKLGCKYAATYPTLSDGQRGNVACNQFGNLLVSLGGAPVSFGDTAVTAMSYGNNAVTPSTSVIQGMLPHNFSSGGVFMSRGDANGTVVQPGVGQWNFTSGTTGILSNTTVAVTFKAAAGASVRNFVDSCQISTTAFTTSVPIAIRDGAGGAVIWAANVPTQGFLTPLIFVFQTPLRGTANTLLEVVTTTANTTGSAMVNCQGHTGV